MYASWRQRPPNDRLRRDCSFKTDGCRGMILAVLPEARIVSSRNLSKTLFDFHDLMR